MRFRLYREHGALNSRPIFNVFEKGLTSLGHEISNSPQDIPVIWSVLWHGRMMANKEIYKKNSPVVIIEVGNLKRNQTWRISLNHINQLGIFGNDSDLDPQRPEKLGMKLYPVNEDRRPEILIATQHQNSLQWEGQPSMAQWVEETVKKIRQYSDRKIIVRPHPRSPISMKIPGVSIEVPQPVTGSYDDFDIDYNYHCVINHNSGPAVQAAIHGTPIICDSTSLAGEISGKFEDIETIKLPPREQWFLKLCHTEWTVDEIAEGIPLKRLESSLLLNNR
jgi:hypothetical protein